MDPFANRTAAETVWADAEKAVLAGDVVTLDQLLHAHPSLFREYGAAVDHPGTAGHGQSIVNGCLANGRPDAADYLARRGARLDLEGAAGVGRLEVVQGFFEKDGRLKADATSEQALSGLHWACEYGHTPVVDFLLERGIPVPELHSSMWSH